jgi:hypothetical protein
MHFYYSRLFTSNCSHESRSSSDLAQSALDGGSAYCTLNLLVVHWHGSRLSEVRKHTDCRGRSDDE